MDEREAMLEQRLAALLPEHNGFVHLPNFDQHAWRFVQYVRWR